MYVCTIYRIIIDMRFKLRCYRSELGGDGHHYSLEDDDIDDEHVLANFHAVVGVNDLLVTIVTTFGKAG